MQKIVLASQNAKKIKELQALLGDLGDFEILPQSVFNIPEADEPFDSFIENALNKARHASKFSGLPALADDSGLCVLALKNAPGVHSARFAGELKSDERNNQKLLELLKNETDRRAFFVCVFVAVRFEKDPLPLVAQGVWHGTILKTPQGKNGFGYDPIFQLEGFQQSAAELSDFEKNAISHRSRALAQFKKLFKECF